MKRRLVELDEDLAFKELDDFKVKRTAIQLKIWLLKVDPRNDPLGFRIYDLPIVEAALNNTLQSPYKGQQPHNWEIREGTINEEYLDLAAPFYNEIRGGHLSPPEIIYSRGKRFAWKDFETSDENLG